MTNRQFRALAWPGVMAAVLCCLLSADAIALPPLIQLDARMRATDDAIVNELIAPGAVLRSGDEVRIKVTVRADGHLYVIALGSSGTAELLHPFASATGDSARGSGLSAPVRSGEVVAVPDDGGYLPLDDRLGQEMIVAFVASQPVESLTRLMFRMEGLFDEPAAAREVLASEGFELGHVSFAHAARTVASAAAPVATTQTPAPVMSKESVDESSTASVPANGPEDGVLGGLGSRIGQFIGQPAKQVSDDPAAVSVALSAVADKQPLPVATRDTPSSQSGSLFSRWFGAEEKSTDNNPAAVAAASDPNEAQKARTFALPQEQPVAHKDLLPRAQPALEERPALRTAEEVPAAGRVPAEPRAAPQGDEERPPQVPAGGRAQRTLSRLFTDQSTGDPDKSKPGVASPGYGRSSAAGPAPEAVHVEIPVVADPAVRDDTERSAEPAAESDVGADASAEPIRQAWASVEPGSESTADRQAVDTHAEVVISRSTDDAQQSSGWFSALGSLFSTAKPVESSGEEATIGSEASMASEQAGAWNTPASDQHRIRVVQPVETRKTDERLGPSGPSAAGEDQASAGQSSVPGESAVPSDPVGDLPAETSTERLQDAGGQPDDSQGGLRAGLSALLGGSTASDDEVQTGTPQSAAPSTELAVVENRTRPEQMGSAMPPGVASNEPESSTRSREKVEAVSDEGGMLVGLGALLTNPFGADQESPVAPTAQAQAPVQSTPQSLLQSEKTDHEPLIKRRVDRDGKEIVSLGGAPAARVEKEEDLQVLGGAGSRIRRLLNEPEPNTDAGTETGGGTLTASSEESPARVPTTASQPESVATRPSPSLSASVAGESGSVEQTMPANAGTPATIPLTPPQQAASLTAAPARALAPFDTPLASVDVNSEGGVASSVVLVITPAGNTSGVVIDRNGHLLTNWHSVNRFDEVVVMFKQARGSMPRPNEPVRARVVAHSKFADLALLKVETVLVGVVPAVLGSDVKMQSGAPIHAIGHAAGRSGNGQWRHNVASVDRVRRSSSWYSAQRVLHRADVIRAEMNPVHNVTGTPLFNNQLELVGLGAMVRVDKGEIVGVSAATIRAFLAAAS